MTEIFTYTYDNLFNPTLRALHNLGGSAKVDEIEIEVAKILNLTEKQINDLHRGNTSKLSYRLAWARNYLKRYGLLDNPSRGNWILTEIGEKTFSVDEKHVKNKVVESDKQADITRGIKIIPSFEAKFKLISKMSTDETQPEIMETEKQIMEEFEEKESQEFYDDEDQEDDGNSVKGKIYIDKKDFTLREYQTMRNDGDLMLQPSYQRKFVIDIKFASRLIESIILDVPIPPVFLAEEEDGKYSVIDGQQRLTSFIAFLDGFLPDEKKTVFKLTGTKELSLEQGKGKTFAQIDDTAIQNKIKTTSIQAVIIKNSSHPDLKFAIFERLNTGSVKLNEDELRNTIYRGAYIDLLKELENDKVFHSMVNKQSFRNRMIYRGMILRFFALTEKSYLNYRSSMKQFCNKELRDNRHMVPAKRQEYLERFNKCVELTRIVFGNNAFRRFLLGDQANPDGKWVTTRVNMAIFDIQMVGFVNYSKSQVVSKADEIREKFLELLTSNADFMNTVENKTNDTVVLKRRFEIWLNELGLIIDKKAPDLRGFKFTDKKTLFDSDQTCKICSQQILIIEDSEVDHVIPFSKGGKTELSNAQLAHRYCNRSKGNRES
jgi:5-methylcytosine-specific restriction endonuclease McrA